MDDDALDAIDVSDFWLDDAALDASSMPVQSLDFGLLMGEVFPRDGLQRPLLTTGSPTHAHVPRRTSKQPINVTHVHQTVVQHFGHGPAACCPIPEFPETFFGIWVRFRDREISRKFG